MPYYSCSGDSTRALGFESTEFLHLSRRVRGHGCWRGELEEFVTGGKEWRKSGASQCLKLRGKGNPCRGTVDERGDSVLEYKQNEGLIWLVFFFFRFT